MGRLQIISFGAGGGHRSTARALADTLSLEQRPWKVTSVDLDDVLEPVDLIFKTTGRRGPDWYNWSLRRGWTSAPERLLPAIHRYLRAMRPHHVRLLRDHWQRSAPDLVVSVMPHYNRALFESLQAESPRTPMVTILTDFADCPPHFWFERQDQHYICGSTVSIRQAQSLGISRHRIWGVSGMIVHPRFYIETDHERLPAECCKLGLDPGLPTALISFGGHGSSEIPKLMERLRGLRGRLQAIVLCGHNVALQAQMQKTGSPFPIYVSGFTEDVARFMRLADFFIGKPGPGSVSEALVAGLPVILEDSSRTMKQERHTLDFILQTRTGMVVPSFEQICPAVERLIQPHCHARHRRRIARLRNRAVFEIPAIFEQIINAPRSHPMPRPALAM